MDRFSLLSERIPRAVRQRFDCNQPRRPPCCVLAPFACAAPCALPVPFHRWPSLRVTCCQLDNSDPNGFAYTGVSKFFVADLRVQYRIDPQWKASVGIDNLNKQTYWAFHPYPQRTFVAELRFDL